MGSVYRSRLLGNTEEKTSRFVTSIKEDERIFEEDINGTEAHDIMLHEQGVITGEDLKKILTSLEKLREEKHRGKIKLDPKYEDVHELIESYVIKEIGLEVGGKLHTGRSRNDQVALDIRMVLRSDLNELADLILILVETLLKRSEENKRSVMILYTHTQHAQIGSFAHYLMAYIDFLFRNLQRLQECYNRVNLSPLGAGPIGGTSIAVDRCRTASLLGFDGLSENTIDAVSSRDFMLEANSALAILMSELSRVVEDLILWSSAEFKYVEVDDRYSSVSSIMPQKKNPNALELIRGKTGRVFGNLMSLLTIVKGLPTGYSSDLQETKPLLWDSIDTVKSSLEVLIGIIMTLKVNTKHMTDVLSESYVFAVDLAEQLTGKSDLSFREAHMVVGNLIKEMISLGMKQRDLKPKTLEMLVEKMLRRKIKVDATLIKSAIEPETVLSERKSTGSPSPMEIERMLKTRREVCNNYKIKLATRVERLNQSKTKLSEIVKKYM
ncbi:MAG: argininosuccinate lyase [Candidatus Bathyarchaeota archaeon]